MLHTKVHHMISRLLELGAQLFDSLVIIRRPDLLVDMQSHLFEGGQSQLQALEVHMILIGVLDQLCEEQHVAGQPLYGLKYGHT